MIERKNIELWLIPVITTMREYELGENSKPCHLIAVIVLCFVKYKQPTNLRNVNFSL